MKLNKVLLRKGYTNIKLKKINTNHFELKAKINGVKGRFILDTGASNSCIDEELIEKFQLQEVEESETKAAGAGAIGMDTQTSAHNTIEIKNWRNNNFTIVILNLSHVNMALTEHKAKAVHGIIGADILEKGAAIIDYKNKRLFLKRTAFKY